MKEKRLVQLLYGITLAYASIPILQYFSAGECMFRIVWRQALQDWLLLEPTDRQIIRFHIASHSYYEVLSS